MARKDYIQIRINEKEKEEFLILANRNNLSLAEWARNILLWEVRNRKDSEEWKAATETRKTKSNQ